MADKVDEKDKDDAPTPEKPFAEDIFTGRPIRVDGVTVDVVPDAEGKREPTPGRPD